MMGLIANPVIFQNDDLLRRFAARHRPRHGFRFPHQCRCGSCRLIPQNECLLPTGRARAGDPDLRQPGDSQAVISRLKKDIVEAAEPNLHRATCMFEAAKIVGDAVRAVHHAECRAPQEAPGRFQPSHLLGGQIKGEKPRLFSIYAAGELHRGGGGNALFPDRRNQVRQAHP